MSEKMDSQEDNVVIYGALKIEIILIMRTYYNNNQNLN